MCVGGGGGVEGGGGEGVACGGRGVYVKVLKLEFLLILGSKRWCLLFGFRGFTNHKGLD